MAVSLQSGAVVTRLAGTQVVTGVCAAGAAGVTVAAGVVAGVTQRGTRLGVLVHQHAVLQV